MRIRQAREAGIYTWIAAPGMDVGGWLAYLDTRSTVTPSTP